jgi:hypothetical protein
MKSLFVLALLVVFPLYLSAGQASSKAASNTRTLSFKTRYAQLVLQNKLDDAQRLLDEFAAVSAAVTSPAAPAGTVTVTNFVTITNIVFITNEQQASEHHRSHKDKEVSAMSDADFDSLMDEIGKANFPADKFEIIKQGGAGNNLSISQIIKLITLFTFDDDRLKVFHDTYKNPPDKNIAYKLYNYFQWDKSKDEVKAVIEANK